jgi:hypothetical protein
MESFVHLCQSMFPSSQARLNGITVAGVYLQKLQAKP